MTSEQVKKALELVKTSENTFRISDLTKKLGVSWSTARYIALLLAKDGVIELEEMPNGFVLRRRGLKK